MWCKWRGVCFSGSPLLAVLWAVGVMMPAWSAVTEVRPEGANLATVRTVHVTYTGGVSADGVTELMSTLDRVNLLYTAGERIVLYINSGGGDMNSGYMGYNAVRNSRIPVTTVNAALVGSSASLIFCGGRVRQAFPEAYFILHPASAVVNGGQEFKPDTLSLLKNVLSHYNDVFYSVYRGCSTLSDADIRTMLSAENQRKDFTAEQARGAGIVSEVVERTPGAEASYFINADKK